VQYDDWAVPVGYEVIHKDLYYCDIKNKKTIRRASISKNQHFRNLVLKACNNQVKNDLID